MTSIIKRIDVEEFVEAFERMGRNDQFSRQRAPRAVRRTYEDYADSTGEDVELDVIGVCCDWSEHANISRVGGRVHRLGRRRRRP